MRLRWWEKIIAFTIIANGLKLDFRERDDGYIIADIGATGRVEARLGNISPLVNAVELRNPPFAFHISTGLPRKSVNYPGSVARLALVALD